MSISFHFFFAFCLFGFASLLPLQTQKWEESLTFFSDYCRSVDLHFVESPALAPPEVLIDMAAQAL